MLATECPSDAAKFIPPVKPVVFVSDLLRVKTVSPLAAVCVI